MLKFKQLNPKAQLPKFAYEGDAGYDLVATSEQTNLQNRYIEYGTGLAVEIPAGYVGVLAPRSSVRTKDLALANSIGVIDQNFRGEIMVTFKPTHFPAKKYEVGERIAQLLILPVKQEETCFVEELSTTERADKGHGSSGA